MSAGSSEKIPGILLPGDQPLRVREVAKGLYVVEDNPYTERYDYFDQTQLYHRKTKHVKPIDSHRPTTQK